MTQVQELQKAEAYILDEVNRVCSENNIKYSLLFGTMLGAVRHKGFIPWDEDIDIGIFYDDWLKFLELCKNGALGDDFELLCRQTHPKYPLSFAKVVLKDTVLADSERIYHYKNENAIWVDIFPIFKVNSKAFLKTRDKLFSKNALYIYLTAAQDYHHKGIVKLGEVLSRKAILLFTSFQKLNSKIIQNILDAGKNPDSCFIFANDIKDKGNFLDSKMMDDFILVDFEGRKFPIFKNYDSILKAQYGNYMELPPVEKRCNPTHIKYIMREDLAEKLFK